MLTCILKNKLVLTNLLYYIICQEKMQLIYYMKYKRKNIKKLYKIAITFSGCSQSSGLNKQFLYLFCYRFHLKYSMPLSEKDFLNF